MKQRILLLITVFFYFVFIFLLSKILFIAVNSSANGGASASDVIDILYHGLQLDLSMSGYLTLLPAIFLILSIWLKPKITACILNVYFIIILFFITLITIADIVVFPYWGFHFDSNVFLYLQNPKDALASASLVEIIAGTLFTIIFTGLFYIGYIFLIRKQVNKLKVPKTIWKACLVLFLLTALLQLPIRGGITVSTMNVGKAYFSDNMFYNQAAINPHFNLLYSMFKSNNFAKQYQFFDKKEVESIFKQISYQPTKTDSVPRLLKTDRPNVIIFILESFTFDIVKDSTIAPNMTRFAREGILFNNFYANSFRTDRGLVSVLGGYPAQPSVAIIKYPQKTASLPAIPRSLKNAGYNDLSLYYGGDVDFANMRSYFIGSCGITDIISDKNYPISQRLTKWGVPDKFVIERLYDDLVTKKPKTPFIKTVLTLSSHEPFDVPVTKFDVPFLNATAYTDECLGDFIGKLKTSKLWDNTLVIMIADHAIQSYPKGTNSYDPARFHIPMIWTGGAVEKNDTISTYGSQNDLAATLLSQLDIDYSEYEFSKDMLNPNSPKFAFYSYPSGFSMIDTSGYIIYDINKKDILQKAGNPEIEKKAKTLFQKMYLDIGNR